MEKKPPEITTEDKRKMSCHAGPAKQCTVRNIEPLNTMLGLPVQPLLE